MKSTFKKLLLIASVAGGLVNGVVMASSGGNGSNDPNTQTYYPDTDHQPLLGFHGQHGQGSLLDETDMVNLKSEQLKPGFLSIMGRNKGTTLVSLVAAWLIGSTVVSKIIKAKRKKDALKQGKRLTIRNFGDEYVVFFDKYGVSLSLIVGVPAAWMITHNALNGKKFLDSDGKGLSVKNGLKWLARKIFKADSKAQLQEKLTGLKAEWSQAGASADPKLLNKINGLERTLALAAGKKSFYPTQAIAVVTPQPRVVVSVQTPGEPKGKHLDVAGSSHDASKPF